MSRRIILSFIFLFMVANLLAQNNVAIFKECNYGGKRVYLTPGSYKLYQMGIENDQVSSMQIPRGLRVTIYEHDDFQGQSSTYTSNVSCLGSGWNDNASSIVVENIYGNNNSNQSDFVTFYNDCYSKGYSQSLRPGTYHGNQLGTLKYNMSSFAIYGNLQVRLYANNEYASGYSTTFQNSESCLNDNYNDKVGSVVIEYKSNTGNNNNNNNNNQYGNTNYATVYTDCNYRGSSLRLSPGYYEGNKLGLMRFDISSIEMPSNLQAKVFVNNEYLNGTYYMVTQNTSCLGSATNNRIGSLIIEERSGYSGNNNNTYPPNQYGDHAVVIYTDEDYKGLSASLLPGTYATMAQAGFSNDALSSLTLPPGYRVVIWEYENFKGKSYTITKSKPGFLLSNWNDKTSSIAVYRQ